MFAQRRPQDGVVRTLLAAARADDLRDGRHVRPALVEGLADAVGRGVGAAPLVLDELPGDVHPAAGPVQEQQERGGPGEQQDPADDDGAPGAEAAAGPAGAGGAAAQALLPQALQGGADPGLPAAESFHRAVQLAPAEPAALQVQLEQRPLDGTDQHPRHDDGEYQQDGRRHQAERLGADGGRVFGDLDRGDHRQA
ncbi:hypothetical protein ACFQ2B_07705 [Streptomyces stramineus]